MQDNVYEPARSIPVLDEVDVAVVGGGVAGCAAACAAARAGAKTMLLERNGCLGGVATASLMANIGNVFLTASGEQRIHGFAGELVDRLVAEGAASPHWRSRDIPGVCLDSEKLKVVLIDMIQEAGGVILAHALGARPILEDARVRGVFVESKSGRQAVLAKAVVDATGEADIAWQAGAEVQRHPGTASTLFKLANVDLDAFVEFLGQDPDGFPAGQDWVKDLETFDRNWKERGVLFFPHCGGRHWSFLRRLVEAGELRRKIGPACQLDAMGMYAIRGPGFVVINSNFYKVKDLDIRELSRFELHAQKMCYYVADFLKRNVAGFEKSAVAHIGVDLGVRVSRRIVGRATLRGADVKGASPPAPADDVIGVTPVYDLKREGGEFIRDFTFDVPFGVTVPQGCDGLLVGSAKSVSTDPAAAIRSMTGCMICGQAAGVASAVAAAQGVAPADAPIRDVQAELLKQGVDLGRKERLAQLGLG